MKTKRLMFAHDKGACPPLWLCPSKKSDIVLLISTVKTMATSNIAGRHARRVLQEVASLDRAVVFGLSPCCREISLSSNI